ncbi:MAG: hypothetical protein HY686_06675 [Chloroflexi bacterium]|nr:hypothetical protein [Chloroflexota bacterium]
MDEALQKVLDTIRPREEEGPDKRCPLAEAVRRHLRPGMTVHLAADAQAAACEVVRAFHGTHPGFTLAASLVEQHALNLVHAGLVRKVITSNFGNMNPTPGPSAIVGRALKAGLEIENWSLLTMCQRFMAGAMGLPFLPTRSLLGSDLARENPQSFQEMHDPFGSGQAVGLVQALRPDVSIVHCVLADREGNGIPAYMDGEAAWAARGAREGVIITAERVVSSGALRSHSPLVKVPAFKVLAVCETPFGAHPQSLFHAWLPEVHPYAEDREFTLEQRRASRRPEDMDAWLRQWVLDVGGHEGYLSKLGARLDGLRQKASLAAWEEEATARFRNDVAPNAAEYMTVVAARRIRERVKANSYRLLLSGVGTGGLAAHMAFYWLRQEGYDVSLIVGVGPFDFLPRNANLDSVYHLATAKITADVFDIYGSYLRGPESRCLGVLGAAQVDRRGNINTTRLADGTFLIGTGGGNDLAAGASEALVVTPLSTQRCRERLDYLSIPGERVAALVSDLGVLEKRDGELTLAAYYPQAGREEAQAIQHIQQQCGWPLRVAAQVAAEPPPTGEELALLRALDLHREFLS